MKLHLLPVLICFTLAPVVINAALSPELYWKSKLPNTKMPKAVKDLLSHGNMGKVIYGDPNKPIFTWQRDVIDQLHDNPNKTTVALWHTTTDQLHYDPNTIIAYGKYAATDQLHSDPNTIIAYGKYAATDQLHSDPNTIIAYGKYAATDQQEDDSCKFLFFSEDKLHPGKKLEMLFTKSPYSTVLVSQEDANTMPFSLNNVPDILKMFSVAPGSKEAQIIKSAIHHCEEPSRTRGEEKECVTSLESMIDYITSKLGKNVKAYSTEVERETQLQTYTIAPGVKEISDEVMACHQTHYPYVLFQCHNSGGSSRAYFVPLEGSDGTRVKAVAVCHSNTLDWDVNHLAFRTLKIKPGSAPVCHFNPADNVVWIPNKAT